MKHWGPYLEFALVLGGILHLCILLASVRVPATLNWSRHLSDLPPLMRQLFWVYGAFIVMTILGFAALTVTNAPTLASGTPLARSICALIATFWLVRLCLQFGVLAVRPYLLTRWHVAGYHSLTIAFAYLVLTYGFGALHPPP